MLESPYYIVYPVPFGRGTVQETAMSLWDYYLQYMTELCEGTRSAPEGIMLHAASAGERAVELQKQLSEMSIAEFVRRCAAAEGKELPQSLYDEFDEGALTELLTKLMSESTQAEEEPPETRTEEPDPDAGKHAFEVFCDCLALDERLIAYLIEVLKSGDRLAFYKLSQITTKLDLDPDEFLYWLAHREDYAGEEEAACAAIMDRCLTRLYEEKQGELLAALLAGDRKTFELFRCEAPELQHLPAATFEWYGKNYLDRDYPLRFLLKCNGVKLPKE